MAGLRRQGSTAKRLEIGACAISLQQMSPIGGKQMRLCLPVAALAVVLVGRTAQAMYPPRTIVGVPVERLVTNVSTYIKRHPDDVQGYYTLARVHSIAFARSFLQFPRTSSSQNQASYEVAIVRGTGNTESQNVLNPEGESIPSAAPVTVIRGVSADGTSTRVDRSAKHRGRTNRQRRSESRNESSGP